MAPVPGCRGRDDAKAKRFSGAWPIISRHLPAEIGNALAGCSLPNPSASAAAPHGAIEASSQIPLVHAGADTKL